MTMHEINEIKNVINIPLAFSCGRNSDFLAAGQKYQQDPDITAGQKNHSHHGPTIEQISGHATSTLSTT